MDSESNRFINKIAYIFIATLFLATAFISTDVYADSSDDSIKILRNRDRGDRNDRKKARENKRQERRQERARPERQRNRDSARQERPRNRDRARPEQPRRNPDRTRPNRPRNPDRTRPNRPSNPDRTRPNRPSNPDRTRPNRPRNPDRTRPNRPSNPDRTRPNRPRNPDRTRPNRPRNPDRVRQERRQRERDRVEREQRRRRQARRADRLRDRDRRHHRRVSRDRYRQHRRYHRYPRRTIRHHHRWTIRYNRWWRNHHRWGHPGWPHDRIHYPSRWPNTSDRWSVYQIINVADNLETKFEHIYNMVANQYGRSSSIATKAYALWSAAQVYSDCVEFYNGNLHFSLYELYNLEEAASNFESELNRYGSSSSVHRHFNVGKFFINELLWQYRQQIGHIDTWRDQINEGDSWRQDANDEWDDVNDTYSSKSFYFWWTKPHRVATWTLDTPTTLSSISLEAVNTNGLRGKNGVAGISEILLIYTDGSELNIVSRSHEKYSQRSGQLVLRDQGDFLEVYNPNPNLKVREIQIKADSWVAPEVDVDIQVNINSYELNSLRNLN